MDNNLNGELGTRVDVVRSIIRRLKAEAEQKENGAWCDQVAQLTNEFDLLVREAHNQCQQ